MLENSIWYKYNGEKSIRATLASFYGCDTAMISNDEVELYNILKRNMTKRELRVYVLEVAGYDDEAIKKEMDLDDKTLEKLKHTSNRKLRQDKIRQAVKSAENQKDDLELMGE
jgi:FixJ family two-component response regulator